MSPYVISLFLLSGISATLMITSQKMLAGYNPYGLYVVVFGISTIVSLIVYVIFDPKTGESIQWNWWMVALGVALVGLNLGYVWLYQQQINLAYVPLIVTGLMTVFAIVVGHFFFQESFSWQAVAGILVVGVGLWLLSTS